MSCRSFSIAAIVAVAVSLPSVAATQGLPVVPQGFTVTAIASGLGDPEGVALDAQGRLLVASWTPGTVYRIDTNGDRELLATGISRAFEPAAIPDGRVLVTAGGTGPGAQIWKIASPEPVVFYSGEGAIGIQWHDGSLYFTQPPTGSVLKSDLEGNTSVFASGLGRGITGMRWSPDGHLYVANNEDGTIYRVSPDGDVKPYVTGQERPEMLAFDPQGNLFFTAFTFGKIYKVDSEKHVTLFASAARESHFRGIVFNEAGDLFVADDHRGVVYRISPHRNCDEIYNPRDLPEECRTEDFVLRFDERRERICTSESRTAQVIVELAPNNLQCSEAGVEAWSLGISSAGARIVNATTEGTAASPLPDGYVDGSGFVRTELTTGEGNEGVISTVVLGSTAAVTLPACGAHQLLELAVEGGFSPGDGCGTAHLQFVDRLEDSSSRTIPTRIVRSGSSRRPVANDFTLELCPCNVSVELVSDSRGSAVVMLRSEVPFRGGEVGIAFDPAAVVPVAAEPGADFPGDPEDLYADLAAEVNCTQAAGGESANETVDAGLVIAWVNDGTGRTMPPGEYALVRLTFEAPAEDTTRPCSPLFFVDCLGVPEAPARNTLVLESHASTPLRTSNGEICVGDDLFRRGDPNADGRFDITDAIYVLGCMFLGDECPTCPDAVDANDDGLQNIADPIYLLEWRFGGGPAPPPPFADCGRDATEDTLGECIFPTCRP